MNFSLGTPSSEFLRFRTSLVRCGIYVSLLQCKYGNISRVTDNTDKTQVRLSWNFLQGSQGTNAFICNLDMASLINNISWPTDDQKKITTVFSHPCFTGTMCWTASGLYQQDAGMRDLARMWKVEEFSCTSRFRIGRSSAEFIQCASFQVCWRLVSYLQGHFDLRDSTIVLIRWQQQGQPDDLKQFSPWMGWSNCNIGNRGMIHEHFWMHDRSFQL